MVYVPTKYHQHPVRSALWSFNRLRQASLHNILELVTGTFSIFSKKPIKIVLEITITGHKYLTQFLPSNISRRWSTLYIHSRPPQRSPFSVNLEAATEPEPKDIVRQFSFHKEPFSPRQMNFFHAQLDQRGNICSGVGGWPIRWCVVYSNALPPQLNWRCERANNKKFKLGLVGLVSHALSLLVSRLKESQRANTIC